MPSDFLQLSAGGTGTKIAAEDYSADAEDQASLKEGESYVVIECADGWAFVRCPTGEEGWVPESYLE